MNILGILTDVGLLSVVIIVGYCLMWGLDVLVTKLLARNLVQRVEAWASLFVSKHMDKLSELEKKRWQKNLNAHESKKE